MAGLRRAVDPSLFARAFLGLCEERTFAGSLPAMLRCGVTTAGRASCLSGGASVDEQGVDRGGDARRAG